MSFSSKLVFNLKFGLPLLQSSHTWKTILRIFPSKLFSKLGTIWKYNLGLCLKKTILFVAEFVEIL